MIFLLVLGKIVDLLIYYYIYCFIIISHCFIIIIHYFIIIIHYFILMYYFIFNYCYNDFLMFNKISIHAILLKIK